VTDNTPQAIAAELNGTPDDWDSLSVLADWYEDRGDPLGYGLRCVVANRWRSCQSLWHPLQVEEGRDVSRLNRWDVEESFGIEPTDSWLEHYRYIAEIYIRRQTYAHHLLTIRSEPTAVNMVALAEWLEEIGDAEAVGWRWVAGFEHPLVVESYNRTECWRIHTCGGAPESVHAQYRIRPAGEFRRSDNVVESSLLPGHRIFYYRSQISALREAARAYAKTQNG